MPRSHQPEGEQPPLTNAERQARYRARHLQQPPPVVIRTRRPVDRRSRPQRWDDAANVLLGLQAEYIDWLAALPDSLRGTAMAEALRQSPTLISPRWPKSGPRGVTGGIKMQ